MREDASNAHGTYVRSARFMIAIDYRILAIYKERFLLSVEAKESSNKTRYGRIYICKTGI
jgi:hypothetical protein